VALVEDDRMLDTEEESSSSLLVAFLTGVALRLALALTLPTLPLTLSPALGEAEEASSRLRRSDSNLVSTTLRT